MARTKTLMAMMITAVLLAFTIVSLTPQAAKAADLNQCAGTMDDKGSDFDGSLFPNITFPNMDLVNQEASARIGNSAPVGYTTVKITAPRKVQVGDVFKLYGNWGKQSHTYYRGQHSFTVTEAGTNNILAKVRAVDTAGNTTADAGLIDHLEIAWTTYAAKKQNAWIELRVRQGFSFSTLDGDTVKPGMKPTVKFGLNGCDGSKTAEINKQIDFYPLYSSYGVWDFEEDKNGDIKTPENPLNLPFASLFSERAKDYGITNPNSVMRAYMTLGKGYKFKCKDLPNEVQAAYGYYIADKDTFHHAKLASVPTQTVKPGSREVRANCVGDNPKKAFFELGLANPEDRFFAKAAVYPDGTKVGDLEKVNGKPSIPITVQIYEVSEKDNINKMVKSLKTRYGQLIENPTSGGAATMPPGEIIIIKKGNGKASGGTLPTGTNVNFTYEVRNVGISTVTGIKVTDSKGVKVTCPKTTLEMNETMTCTGSGPVK